MIDRVVVITGASKGIGRATALYLDKQGFRVFAGVRSAADGEGLRKEASDKLVPLPLDVTNSSQIEAAAEQVSKAVGADGLAGLVNNAGIALAAPLEYIPIDELRRQLEINVVAQVAVTQAFLPSIRQAHGRIVNISSIGGRLAAPVLGAYNASKFALEAISDTLRLELMPWGIEVICVEPGSIATPIWETSIAAANKITANMPPRFHELYDGVVAKSQKWAAESAKSGIPPERVAEVIWRALTVPRPKTRYLVGSDARFAGTIITRLPDRMRDRLLSSR
jgi:NAD(P)-dependent dehydrogenase (short-subunit alcohol dehydrogenase family)